MKAAPVLAVLAVALAQGRVTSISPTLLAQAVDQNKNVMTKTADSV
jgi:hypothetical protein